MYRFLLLTGVAASIANAIRVPGLYGHYNPKVDVNSVLNCRSAYVVQDGDTCGSILASFAVSQDEFAKINPGVTCEDGVDLVPGTLVCVPNDVSSITDSLEVDPSGNSTVDITATETAVSPDTGNSTMATAAPIQVTYTCDFSYTLKKGDDCFSVSAAVGLNMMTEFALNPHLDCLDSKSLPGKSMCLRGTASTGAILGKSHTGKATSTPVPVSSCAYLYSVPSNQTCFDVLVSFKNASLTISDLDRLNPGIDCWNLVEKTKICLNAPSRVVTGLPKVSTTSAAKSASSAVPDTPAPTPPPPSPQQAVIAQSFSSLTLGGPDSDNPPSAISDFATDCLTQLNYARAHYTGAPGLTWDSNLGAYCQPVSDFCALSAMEHFGLGGDVAGQILASGGNCAAAYPLWVTQEYPSGGHYQIITSSSYSRVGCSVSAYNAGCVCCDFGF